ncbi:ankyrin repeat domain-containing protein [Wolbachia endosymbiont (group A) of Conops quadrifasciatus]|uniref:ankyrin repeat domain-containing protein n=1 Tax=Wolbachia endosymbiont (group A) of Conops quadrifasciatus TaxID=3066143 RepID=UPI00397957D2
MSVDETDKEGRTPLYYAAWKGHSEAVKFLADKRANIHAENTYGTKPIHVATMEGHQRVIEFLLSNGMVGHLYIVLLDLVT